MVGRPLYGQDTGFVESDEMRLGCRSSSPRAASRLGDGGSLIDGIEIDQGAGKGERRRGRETGVGRKAGDENCGGKTLKDRRAGEVGRNCGGNNEMSVSGAIAGFQKIIRREWPVQMQRGA